jgi:putative membrane protein
MRLWPTAFLIGGLGLVAWLVASVGVPAVAGALHAVGMAGLLVVIGVHLIALLTAGTAWWLLRRTRRLGVFIWGRLVRDAGSEVLSLSQVGGLMLAVRVLVRDGVSTVHATAVTLVDATMEFIAQIAYELLGLILTAWLMPHRLAGLSFTVPLVLVAGIGGAWIAFRRGPPPVVRRIAARLAQRRLGMVFDRIAAVRLRILAFRRVKPLLALSLLVHLTAWIVSGLEAWLALRFMGVSLGFAAVLAIESLVYGARSLGFMVPNAVGVQEGAYVVLGTALGLSPEFALGLSLLKRGRDLALGIPVVLAWHLIETRLAPRRRAHRPAEPVEAWARKPVPSEDRRAG